MRADLSGLIIILSMFISGCTLGTSVADRHPQSVIRVKVYNDLVGVRDAVESKVYDEALIKLSDILDRRADDLTSYERAQIFNYCGYIYYSINEKGLSIAFYQKVLDERYIPDGFRRDLFDTISKLYFVTGEYKKTIDTLARQVSLDFSLAAEQHLLLARSHYRLGNSYEVIKHLDLAEIKGSESGDLSIEVIRKYRAKLIDGF